MNVELNTLEINGVTYVPLSSVPPALAYTTGKRAVLSIDRGWVFAGDLTEHDGMYRLERAVNVVRWDLIGFSGMIADPKSTKVKINLMSMPVEVPKGSVLFSVPVPDNWGL